MIVKKRKAMTERWDIKYPMQVLSKAIDEETFELLSSLDEDTIAEVITKVPQHYDVVHEEKSKEELSQLILDLIKEVAGESVIPAHMKNESLIQTEDDLIERMNFSAYRMYKVLDERYKEQVLDELRRCYKDDDYIDNKELSDFVIDFIKYDLK